ncbi:hypothetical protein [Hymenobacter metallicola]|uniref:Uncharacterized protein n=1 Tax=Hymenobacter metallicola TaxID=2563114 RepID=A0A4Z0Q0K8_9BACT|nr:hypothetical protein [Hymenobacter metallicola]TGE22693.1 hypothetical protein E5K02_23455 [Hymenobacter metallicola]
MEPTGQYRYRLYHCQVAAATGEGLVQESALERVLDDTDFLPDVTLFYQRLTSGIAQLPR